MTIAEYLINNNDDGKKEHFLRHCKITSTLMIEILLDVINYFSKNGKKISKFIRNSC